MKPSFSGLGRYAGRGYALGLAAWLPFSGKLELAREGHTPYVVVQGQDATEAEKFAAREMTNFLHRITGALFPLFSETNRPAPAKGIYVGWTEFAARQGVAPAAWGREEWVIKSVGKNLVLTGGRPRGTLYGVYEFLDKYGGCRWVSLDMETVPKRGRFEIPGVDVSGKPAFSWREIAVYPGNCGSEALYRVRNRLNVGKPIDKPEYGFAEHFGRPGFCHTFNRYQKDWTDVKPEYYALFEGKRQPRGAGDFAAQFCLTNPEVREKVYRTLLEFIKADRKEAAERGAPYPTRYDISHNDHMRYCQCPGCMAIAEREGSYAGPNIDFINSLAARLKKDYPDLSISTFAYTYTAVPPKTIRPLDNVDIRIALLDREFKGEAGLADAARPLTHPANREAKALIDQWQSVASGHLLSWGYAQLWRAPYRYPFDTSDKIAGDLEYVYGLGSTYAFFEHGSLDMPFSWLGKWLFAQKALDPERDTRALVDDFMTGYFGPAAKVMRTYRDDLVKTSHESPKPLGATPPPQLPYLTADFFRRANACLDKAEKLCAGAGHAKYLRNVGFERVPVDSGTLYLWNKFAGKPGFENRDAIIERYQANKKALCALFPTREPSFILCANALEGEMAALKIPVPEEFKERNPSLRYAISLAGKKSVPDPAASGGLALRLGQGNAGEHTLPFMAKIHDATLKKDLLVMKLDKVPVDGRYHWHKIGDRAELTADCGFWASVYAWIPMGWAAMPPPNNGLEVYVSLKFTGPAYVPGSTDPDEVHVDRILAVPPLDAQDKKHP